MALPPPPTDIEIAEEPIPEISSYEAPISAPVEQPVVAEPVKTGPSWEKAWSLQELREGVSNWTLASDSGLYNFMQEFSNRIISRTKEVSDLVEDLVYETKKADVKVHNTFNQFLLLSNVQFVENRVYDEDETNTTQEATKDEVKPQNADVELSKEQKEAILIPKYTTAISTGMEALKKAIQIEQIPVEGTTEVVVEQEQPKDPYSKFRLPHIIGTKEFNEDEFCGIRFNESEEEEEEESEESAESDEETDDDEKKNEGDKDENKNENQDKTEVPKDNEQPKESEPQEEESGDEYETESEEEELDVKAKLEKSLKAQLGGLTEEPAPTGEKKKKKKKKEKARYCCTRYEPT